MIQLNKIYKFLLGLVFLAFLNSCSEEAPIESDITYYPTFEYEDLVVVDLGDDFTPSANATEDDNQLTVTTSSNVNTSVVGVYDVTYSATNSDGYAASVNQTVIVHDPSIVGTDVSGAIWDKGNNSRTGVITLVEGTTSIFHSTDFGFAGAFPVYFQMDGDVISEIPQSYINGVSSVDLTYDPVTMEFTTLINPQGFGYTFEYQN